MADGIRSDKNDEEIDRWMAAVSKGDSPMVAASAIKLMLLKARIEGKVEGLQQSEHSGDMRSMSAAKFKFGWDAVAYLKGFLGASEDRGAQEALAHLDKLLPVNGPTPAPSSRSSTAETFGWYGIMSNGDGTESPRFEKGAAPWCLKDMMDAKPLYLAPSSTAHRLAEALNRAQNLILHLYGYTHPGGKEAFIKGTGAAEGSLVERGQILYRAHEKLLAEVGYTPPEAGDSPA
jgi:hypothetical protein